MKKPTTSFKKKVVNYYLNNEDVTVHEIEKKFEVSKTSIINWLKIYAQRKYRRPPKDPTIKKQIVDYYISNKSESVLDTAKHFSVSTSFVSRILKDNNINKATLGYDKNNYKDQKIIHYELSDELEELIKTRKNQDSFTTDEIFKKAIINFYQEHEKLSMTECGRIFGVSQSTVSRILRAAGLKVKTLSDLHYALTDSEQKDLVRDYSKIGFEALAEKYNISRMSTLRILRKHNVDPKNPSSNKLKKYDDEVYEELIKDYKKGMKETQLGEKYNFSVTAVGDILNRNKIEKRSMEQISISYDIDDNAFKNIDNQEKAYWLGMLAADGGTDGKEFRLAFNSKDHGHLEKFAEFLKTNRPIKRYKKKYKKYKEVEMSLIAIGSIKMCRDLMANGIIPRKTHLLQFPNKSSLPKHLRRHYIRGYFDGDGNIYTRKNEQNKIKNIQWQLVGNEQFLLRVQKIMSQELKMDKHKMQIIFPERNNNIRRLRWHSMINLLKIYYFLYDDATVFLERKHDIFQKVRDKVISSFFSNKQKIFYHKYLEMNGDMDILSDYFGQSKDALRHLRSRAQANLKIIESLVDILVNIKIEDNKNFDKNDFKKSFLSQTLNTDAYYS